MTETDVIEAKRLRRAARSVFDTQKKLVQADLGAASLGKRVASRIAEDGRFVAEEAMETANRHKAGVTVGALALTGWFLRKPIMAFVAGLGGSDEEDQPADDGQVHEETAEV